jgi:hypothetical protein
MSYDAYGVNVVCKSNKNKETQEFLFHQIVNPHRRNIKDAVKNDAYWIEVAADLIANQIELGDRPGDINEVENDWAFTVKYGVFQ